MHRAEVSKKKAIEKPSFWRAGSMQGLSYWRKLPKHIRILLVLFILSLPLVNPWVRGDGVGYYAYARAMVVDHNLRFEKDWFHANTSFFLVRVDGKGRIRPEQYTRMGYLNNHFTVGPAILWSPFLLAAHGAVLGFDCLGGHIPADGFSWPYLDAMAVSTAIYGFLGLLFSFWLAQKYFPQRWAFLATIGIWFASSLPVYMYFNPSWSHAHSAFAVALFLWYWDRTRGRREIWQWGLLGFIAGLMVDVYYPNFIFLLAPTLESLRLCWPRRQESSATPRKGLPRLALGNGVFAAAALIAFSPTLITRWILYGSPFVSGYYALSAWHWGSPALWKVLFSADHGLFSWTPILILSFLGLFALAQRDRGLGAALLSSALIYYYCIASYPDWDGISSFGNRFFISLTPIFVVGLAAALDAFEKIWKDRRGALVRACTVIFLLIAWNLGFVYQWGMHLIYERGAISWREMVYNQFRVVPEQAASSVERYFVARKAMMGRIEKMDVKQLQQENRPVPDGKH